MGVTKFNSNTSWHAIRSGQSCPICGKKNGRCGYMKKDDQVELYRCKYMTSNKPSGDGWYIHLAKELNGDTSKINDIVCNDYVYEPITDELLNIWNNVYRMFRKIFIELNGSALYENHKKNLTDRGLDESIINNGGFFSIPNNQQINYDNYNCSLRTAIVHELLKYFKPETLIRVPGFKKINSNGKNYIVFINTMYNPKTKQFEDIDAYFVPFYDYKGRFVGMQYRLMNPIIDADGKTIRYLWYVTKDVVSCGSPIDYHVPQKIEIDDVILITEGSLKAKVASEKIGVRSLAEAGVSNYRKLIHELQLLEELEGKKYKILLALDMDKYTNKDVLTSEINTVAMLKGLGYSVTILEWDIAEGKGIDDKLNVSKAGFRFLTV